MKKAIGRAGVPKKPHGTSIRAFLRLYLAAMPKWYSSIGCDSVGVLRLFSILSAAIILGGATVAQANDVRSAVAALDKATKKRIDWVVAKARSADVTCDGRADTILFGTDRQSVWIGVVSETPAHAWVFQFPAAGNSEDAFAGPPTAIKIHPRDCDGDERDRLPGCRRIPGCKAFAIENEADAFHFYWDDQRKMLRWWRL